MHARKSRDEWQSIIAEFEASGQSHAEFCSAKRINVGSFRGWLYRVRRDGSSRAIALLPVRVAGAAKASAPETVAVRVEDVEVRVFVGTDVAYVAALVGELRRC